LTECLDSWAILAWLEGEEPAASRVELALQGRPIMSWINLGEVAYVLERRVSAESSGRVVRELRRVLELDLPSEERVLAAARLKARHPMAYADAFAVATAVAHSAQLLTGDPEILGADADWQLVDLRE
jgi:predicted nucleic acid-binding protein